MSAPPLFRAAAASLRRRRSVILCYHGVGARSTEVDPEFLLIPPARFRAQAELLRGAGFRFVTVAELAERARASGGHPPPGLAALSFDDGMENNHSVLLPILQELGLPATVYVATGLIGAPNPWLAEGSGARMMTPEEIRDLAGAGVEIGAHTVGHRDLSRLDRATCLDEMLESRRTLERLTGLPVRTFAYPFCRYGDAALAAAAEAGFEAAVTCQGRGSWAPYEMRRALITGKDGWPSFLLKLADRYQPLFESAPVRALRLTSRGARRAARTAIERRGRRTGA